jgi:hypothetical protein
LAAAETNRAARDVARFEQYEQAMSKLTELTDMLIDMGAREWTGDNAHRIYLTPPVIAQLLGLPSTFRGEAVSAGQSELILSAAARDGIYLDVTAGRWGCKAKSSGYIHDVSKGANAMVLARRSQGSAA